MKLLELVKNHPNYLFDEDMKAYIIIRESKPGVYILYKNMVYTALVVHADSSVEIGHDDGSAEVLYDYEYHLTDTLQRLEEWLKQNMEHKAIYHWRELQAFQNVLNKIDQLKNNPV